MIFTPEIVESLIQPHFGTQEDTPWRQAAREAQQRGIRFQVLPSSTDWVFKPGRDWDFNCGCTQYRCHPDDTDKLYALPETPTNPTKAELQIASNPDRRCWMDLDAEARAVSLRFPQRVQLMRVDSTWCNSGENPVRYPGMLYRLDPEAPTPPQRTTTLVIDDGTSRSKGKIVAIIQELP